jgi:hypothetical protein
MLETKKRRERQATSEFRDLLNDVGFGVEAFGVLGGIRCLKGVYVHE